MDWLADLIFFIHILIFLFVVCVPFVGSDILVLMNLVFMIGILVHWICNNNICVLTVIEKAIRGIPNDTETFFGRIFGGVYGFGKDSKITWWVLCFLILLSIYKVVKNKAIQNIIHEFRDSYTAFHKRI